MRFTKRTMILGTLIPIACAILTQAPGHAEDVHDIVIKDVPHIKQKEDFCGEACVAMMLKKGAHKLSQDQVFALSKVDPRLGRGMVSRELFTTLKKLGYNTGPGWHKINSNDDKAVDPLWQALTADLTRGIPSIVCMRYDDKPNTTEHFRLILGFNASTKELIYHEPAIDKGSYQRMTKKKFVKLWPLKYSKSTWTVIRFRLAAKVTIPKLVKPKSWTPAELCRHFMTVREKIASKAFTTLIEDPFVVIGDEDPATVKRRSKNTVRWAVKHLKKLYFDKNPKSIIDIWLFKNKSSYRKHCKEFFDDTPGTPFGYYSPSQKILVMNISTGGGTLVHEIVHPFIETNFPQCPSWFNEGLASLYEQCGTKEGRINGYTNWRLAGLQRAIKKNSVPSFKTLMSTSTDQFYNEDPGTNYSQARYLCYYLQEKGLLVSFYKNFNKDAKNDSTGLKTLKKILRTKDLISFKKEWETWILKLKYN
jgi:hypothetical protein